MTITLDNVETLVSDNRKIYNPVQKDYATFLKTNRKRTASTP